MILLQLFLSFFQVGLFSIGGGYAAMPLIQAQVVDLHPWITMEQFADIMTISEMTPGPIALNSATFVGLQVAGIPGAVIATLGCVVPSSFIVLCLAYIYYRFRGLNIVQGILAGLRPAVIAMISSAGLSILILSVYGSRSLPSDMALVMSPDLIAVVVFIASFIAIHKFKVDQIYAIFASGLAGILLYMIAGV